MKYLGTFLIALSLIGCDATQRGFEKAYAPTIDYIGGGPSPNQDMDVYTPKPHLCVNMDVAAGRVYDMATNPQNKYAKDAIINELNKHVKDDPSYRVLIQGVEFLYHQTAGFPPREEFSKNIVLICEYKFGQIADGNHV